MNTSTSKRILFAIIAGPLALLFTQWAARGAAALAAITVREVNGQDPGVKEPLQFLASGAGIMPGRLAYAAHVAVPKEKMWQSYISVRNVGGARLGERTLHVLIPDAVPALAFEPQFSSSGQSVLFKVGWPFDEGVYDVCEYVLGTRQFKSAWPKGIRYRKIGQSEDERYLAFCRGGDQRGYERGRPLATGPIRLCIFDKQTARETVIATNPAARSFAWSKQGTLLYSSIDVKKWYKDVAVDDDLPTPQAGSDKASAVRPDLYEARVDGGEPTVVAKDMYLAQPSPDNRWIAGVSSADPAGKVFPLRPFDMRVPAQASIVLLDRQTGRRRQVSRVTESYPQMLWTKDSKQLLVLTSTVGGTGKATGTLSVFNIGSGRAEAAVKLEAKDFAPLRNPATQLHLADVTATAAVLKVSEPISVKENVNNEMITYVSVNLTTGTLTTLVRIYNEDGNSLGQDWRAAT